MGWLVVFCFICAFRSSSWVRIALNLAGSDDNAYVLMPAQLEQVDSSAARKQFIARDSAGTYGVRIWNIMTGDGLHDSHRKRMYEDIIRWSTDGTNERLFSRAEVLIANYRGVEFVIKEMEADTSQATFFYARCVITEHKGYLLYFVPMDKGKHNGVQGNSFFNSFALR